MRAGTTSLQCSSLGLAEGPLLATSQAISKLKRNGSATPLSNPRSRELVDMLPPLSLSLSLPLSTSGLVCRHSAGLDKTAAVAVVAAVKKGLMESLV